MTDRPTRIEYFEVTASSVMKSFAEGITAGDKVEITGHGDTYYDPAKGIFLFKLYVRDKA